MRKDDKRENIVVSVDKGPLHHVLVYDLSAFCLYPQLIASEPLTFEKADWLEIPCQTCVVVTPR